MAILQTKPTYTNMVLDKTKPQSKPVNAVLNNSAPKTQITKFGTGATATASPTAITGGLSDKDQRFIRHMEADESLHDAGRLAHYVELQKKSGNPTFGNKDLQRYYNQVTGAGKPAQPAQPGFDPNAYMNQFQDQINNMYNQQRAAQLAQLQAQRDRAIGQINQQKAELKPQYQGMKNQADVVNLQNVQKLRELMAANGLSATGENVSANVAANNERLNSINSLNLQEQQQRNDYDRRIADLNNPADENALMAQLEAERSRALLEMGMKADEIGYSRGRDTEMDKRYYDETTYNRGRDAVGDKRYDSEWEYQKGRDARRDAEWESQQKADRAWREYTFNNMSASEKAQLKWAQEQFGEELGWQYYAKKMELASQEGMAQAELDFYNSGFNNVQGGGGYSNNYKTQQQASKSSSFKTYQTHLNEAVKMGVPAQWANALTELVGRESSWNPSAKNPNSTAHGYGQFLNSTRSNYEKKTGLNYGNPVHQLVMMAQYVKDRYGTPEKALAFWDKNKWY